MSPAAKPRLKAALHSLMNFCRGKKTKEPPIWCPEFSLADSTAMKAVAMFMIVAHNFLHNVQPKSSENEFFFNAAAGFWQMLGISASMPGETLHAFLAFFGHYGVQIFVVLSGYGLARKMLSTAGAELSLSPADIPARSLMKTAAGVSGSQIVKMFKLISVAAPVAYLYQVLVLGHDPITLLAEFGRFITFSNNLHPAPGVIWDFVSVWWFFALIMQLYLLFPLLFAGLVRHRTLTLSAVFAALGIAGAFYDGAWAAEHHLLLFATPLSHASVFSVGILLALGHGIRRPMFEVLLCVFFFAEFVPLFFPVSFVALALLLLYGYDRWGRSLTRMRTVMRFGAMSMFVFVLHGFLRHPWTGMLNDRQKALFAETGTTDWALTLVSFAGWFAWVVIASLVVEAVYRRLWAKAS